MIQYRYFPNTSSTPTPLIVSYRRCRHKTQLTENTINLNLKQCTSTRQFAFEHLVTRRDEARLPLPVTLTTCEQLETTVSLWKAWFPGQREAISSLKTILCSHDILQKQSCLACFHIFLLNWLKHCLTKRLFLTILHRVDIFSILSLRMYDIKQTLYGKNKVLQSIHHYVFLDFRLHLP